MSDNPAQENLGEELEKDSVDYSAPSFTFSRFDTRAVFGESLKEQLAAASGAEIDPAPTLQPDDFRRALPLESFSSSDYLPPPIFDNQDEINPPAETRFCFHCGMSGSVDFRFCLYCGNVLDSRPNSSQTTDKTVMLTKIPDFYERTSDPFLPDDNNSENRNYENLDTPQYFQEGTILDNRYRVIKHLETGGFADIYSVENTDSYFPEIRVLKLLRTDINAAYSCRTPEELRNSFQKKYKKWRILSQEEPDFIVRLDDVKVVAQRVGIVMELMEGGTLLKLVDDWGGKPQTHEQLKKLVRLFIEASRALYVIHKYKLIHCDVKPHNFLLDTDHQKCKLCDFELLNKQDKKERENFSKVYTSDETGISGTPTYMSPESFAGEHSIKSDVFALGVTFYYLLSGKYPYDNSLDNLEMLAEFIGKTVEPPKSLTELNTLVPASLDRLVQWCLEIDPAERPDSIADLIYRLMQLGISDEESNFAPVNLARLMVFHLSDIDRKMIIKHLQKQNFRSMSDAAFQEQDMIEEFCYTTSPFEILDEHCGSSLYVIAESLKIDIDKYSRKELVKEIVKALGFLPGKKQAHGFETIRRDLELARIKFEGAETVAECRGHLDHAFAETERAVNLLVSFYGQTLYGKGLKSFLSKRTKGKPFEKLSFGAKIEALRDLCMQKPKAPLPERVERLFTFPLISQEIFERLGKIVFWRNEVAHNRTEFIGVHDIQTTGQQILQSIVETIKSILSSQFVPRVVQITNEQIDVFGRQFYEGFDEKGKKEKIFTTFGLRVGELYWFVPLTNPARINPLILNFEDAEEN